MQIDSSCFHIIDILEGVMPMNGKRAVAFDFLQSCEVPVCRKSRWTHHDFAPIGPEYHVELEISPREGVLIIPFSQKIPEQYRTLLPAADVFLAHQHAFLSRGATVYISQDTLDTPIVWSECLKYASCDHLILIVAPGVKAVFIEDISSDDSVLLHNSAVEIFLGEDSDLTYVCFQNLSHQTLDWSYAKAKLADNAKITWFDASFGARATRSAFLTDLDGRCSESQMRMIFTAKEEQKKDLYVQNLYNGRDVSGEMHVRGVVKDRAQLACEGMIKISAEGQGTRSYLKQDTLSLSPTARVDAVPSLEIEANEVKAGHGATVSRVHEDELFYLASRGIKKDQAESLVVEGFLRSLTDEFVHIPYIGKKLEELIISFR